MLQVAHAITNLDHTFAEADDAYYQMMQLTPTELCRRDIFSITYPADRAQNSTSLHQLINHGAPFWIRKRYVRDDGSLIWVLNHVTRTIGITGIVRLAAASFILPPDLISPRGDGVAPDGLAKQTEMLKRLL